MDWERIEGDLDAHGCAVVEGMLTAGQCAGLARSYENRDLFRSRMVGIIFRDAA